MKRQRGRSRRPGGNQGNRSFESNGPEVKIRGNASQIHDKYLQLARDASTAGNRVRAENLHQHAEHYFRILQATMPKRDPAQEDSSDKQGADGASTDQNENTSDSRDQREHREPRRGRGRGRDRNQSRDPMNVVTPETDTQHADTPASDNQPDVVPVAKDEDDAPRRRTRRPRRPREDSSATSDQPAAEAVTEVQTEAATEVSTPDDTSGGDDSATAAA
jgi:hypothetical protein